MGHDSNNGSVDIETYKIRKNIQEVAIFDISLIVEPLAQLLVYRQKIALEIKKNLSEEKHKELVSVYNDTNEKIKLILKL